MPFSLGPYHYPQPVIVLAPMAGVSDLPFRRLCQENGADYSTAEMISAKPELLHTAHSATRLQFAPDPRYPKIVQLVGGDAALMAEAALLMQAKGADIIDINMGCPAKTIARQQAGSALLADLKQVEKILAAVVRAVNIPVTLKTRLGYRDGEPVIAEVKAKNRLPVIANGDIVSAAQAKNLLDRYGFDGLMIGRAALGDPWLFARCQAAINGRALPATDKNAQIRSHLRALHEHYGAQATAIARKHLHAYLRPHPDYPALRPAINHAAHLDAQLALIPH